MSPTEIQLFALHRAPTVPLAEVCEKYLQLSQPEALRRAALHKLPFPTFRLTTSQKGPVMVKLTDLAAHIDSTHEAASAEWEHSQV